MANDVIDLGRGLFPALPVAQTFGRAPSRPFIHPQFYDALATSQLGTQTRRAALFIVLYPDHASLQARVYALGRDDDPSALWSDPVFLGALGARFRDRLALVGLDASDDEPFSLLAGSFGYARLRTGTGHFYFTASQSLSERLRRLSALDRARLIAG